MRYETLQEALDELEVEKQLLDATINDLKALIARAGNIEASTVRRSDTPGPVKSKAPEPQSYVDLAVEAIRTVSGGSDMHLNEILRHIRSNRLGEINRAAVEATLSGHTRRKNPKLIKTGVARYGLPRSE